MNREQNSTRRDLLRGIAGGVAVLQVLPRWAVAQVASPVASAAMVADAKWASLIALGDKTWAVVSKPREGAFETLCNGGLVAGSERLLAFDSYASPGGAQWVVERSRELTGRAPTDVVLSHHHGDHTRGLAGFASGSDLPQVWTTGAIRDRVVAAGAEGAAAEMLMAARLVDEAETTVDLGGRVVVLSATSGHTPSDLVARVDDSVLFCGDLVWNELFPNYVDALPDLLGPSVGKLLAAGVETLVPGHGPVPDRPALDRYAALLSAVEAAGRASFEAGKSPTDAARDFALPADLGEWTLFSPNYFEVAFRAWHRRLGA